MSWFTRWRAAPPPGGLEGPAVAASGFRLCGGTSPWTGEETTPPRPPPEGASAATAFSATALATGPQGSAGIGRGPAVTGTFTW